LYSRAVRGGAWTLAAYGADTSTRIVSSLIMTRLLFPEAFGLVTAAMSLIVGIALISDVGIRTVIMRSVHGEDANFLRFAWTLQVLRGFVLWFALVLFCLFLDLNSVRTLLPSESVFASGQFPLITAALGLALVLAGLESTAVHLNSRRLNLRPVIFIDVISRIISLPVMIAAAWSLRSVWAIVIGTLLTNAIRLAMTHLFVPGPRMRAHWEKAHIGEFFHIGKWTSAASAATFISGQGDRLFIGLFLSSSVLGLYSVAKLAIEALSSLFDRLNSSLAVPVLGEVIRKDADLLRAKYYRFRLPFDLSAPLLAGIVSSAGSTIIGILYDPRYIDAGYMLQILALGLVMFPPSLILSAFPLSGNPEVSAIVSAVQATSLFTFMLIGFGFAGVSGTIYGIALHRIVPTAVTLVFSYRRGWLDLWKEFRIVPVFGLGWLFGNCLTLVAGYFF
jgi:O-antigen/teichoic acid export membrane protein